MPLDKSVFFPSPPPTSNSLTPTERACLKRSTAKLGRILGVIPTVLDADDFDTMDTFYTLSTSRAGSVSPSRQTSSKGPVRIRLKAQHASPTLTPRGFHDDECHRRKSTHFVENGASKLGTKSTPVRRPRLMRVTHPLWSQHVSKLNHTLPDSYSSSESVDSDDDTIGQYTPALDAPDNGRYARRKKMERLYRIFGDELPVSSVFPEESYHSDNDHWESPAKGERLGPTVRTPCHRSPSPSLVKLQTAQTSPSAIATSSPPRIEEAVLISVRDFSTISTSIPHLNGFPPRRPHYRLRSSLCISCDNGMQSGGKMNQIGNPVIGGVDVRILRTISESSKEVDGLCDILLADEARGKTSCPNARKLPLSSHGSYSSLRSEWYSSDESDEETDDAHTEETLVEKKEAPIVSDVTQVLPKKVWSHKRKPPPAYDP